MLLRAAISYFCLLMSHSAWAVSPLIYEGTLTSNDQSPDPWPGLRFSVVDANGAVWWSTLVDPGGPLIDVGPDGRFVAYLEDSPENPWAVAGFDQGRWLRVEVCPGPWPANPADDCEWVQLEQTQRLGTVPMAETVSETERARIVAEAMEQVRADIWVQPDVPGGDVATLRVSHAGGDGDFPSVQAALASIRGLLIPQGMTVDIAIAWDPIVYLSRDGPIAVGHPQGRQIHIRGEPPPREDLGPVILEFPDSQGLEVDTGVRVSGVIIRGNSEHQRSLNGVVVRVGATVIFGAGVIVEDFSDDCLDVYSSYLSARGVTVRNCGGHGVHVVYAGYAEVRDAIAENNGRANFQANAGGGMHTRGAQSDTGEAGFVAETEGWIVR